MINCALPKGRLGEKVLEVLENAGYDCPEIHEDGTRKLVFENKDAGIRYFWVKPSDVAVYVERGAADVGIVGRDILVETSPDVYELADLGIGKCRMCVAAPRGFVDDRDKTLVVATKFPETAKMHYAKKSRDIDIVKLNGSIELSAVIGLADVIVDIVETGKTLYANDLDVIETVFDISARLITNKSALKFKKEQIDPIADAVRTVQSYR